MPIGGRKIRSDRPNIVALYFTMRNNLELGLTQIQVSISRSVLGKLCRHLEEFQ